MDSEGVASEGAKGRATQVGKQTGRPSQVSTNTHRQISRPRARLSVNQEGGRVGASIVVFYEKRFH